MTQRIEYFLKRWLKELNTFCKDDSKNWIFFEKMTQRIEYFLKRWLKELNTFWKDDSKNWILFWKYDSKNWTIFEKKKTHKNWNLLFIMTQRNWTHFFSVTQRIFFILKMSDSKNKFDFFLKKNIKELNFSTWLEELNFFSSIWLKELIFDNDSKNCFFNMTQRIEPFLHDSTNWTFFRTVWIKGVNLLLEICLKELNFL